MKVLAVLPARMGSSRFPGKPLAQIAGRPMIEHVYWRSFMCKTLEAVYVATCDQEILEATEKFGGRAIMTSHTHVRATDRAAEVARRMDAGIIVMVQGDEPMIVPEMIDLSLGPLLDDQSVVCTNLAAPIRSVKEFEDPSTIKVVMAQNGDALCFSRSPIPSYHPLVFNRVPAYKQVCVISFRRDFLLQFTKLKPTPLEEAESIDVLRALEHGFQIRMVKSPYVTYSVDTQQDLAHVEALMQRDPLVPHYSAQR